MKESKFRKLVKTEKNFAPIYLIYFIPFVLVFVTLFTSKVDFYKDVSGGSDILLYSNNFIKFLFDGGYTAFGVFIFLLFAGEVVLLVLETVFKKFRENLIIKTSLVSTQIVNALLIFAAMYCAEGPYSAANIPNANYNDFVTTVPSAGNILFGLFTFLYLVFNICFFVYKFDVFNNKKKVHYEPLLSPAELMSEQEKNAVNNADELESDDLDLSALKLDDDLKLERKDPSSTQETKEVNNVEEVNPTVEQEENSTDEEAAILDLGEEDSEDENKWYWL